MAKYRIVTNDVKFKIQEKSFLSWEDLVTPHPTLLGLKEATLYHTKEDAQIALIEYKKKNKKWKVVK